MDFTLVFYMALLLAAGFAAGRAKLIDAAGRVTLASLLFNLTYPALVIDSITKLNIYELAGPSFIVVAVTLAMTLALYFIGRAALKLVKDENRKPIVLFVLGIGNVTFVTMPLLEHFFGARGVYYTVLYGSAQDVFLWTIYYMYFVGRGKSVSLKKLLSPTSVSLAAAIVMAAFGIKPAGALDKFFTSLGQMAVPTALIYVGSTMAASGFHEWKPDWQTLAVCAVKIFVIPCVFYCGTLLFALDPELRVIMTLMLASPVPVMTTILAKQYGCDELFAIRLLLFSTLFFFAAAAIFLF